MTKFTQPARVEPEQIDPLRPIRFDSFPGTNQADFNEWLNEIAEEQRWLFIAETHQNVKC